MTIAAGFRCGDGIVLCADTEETISDVSKTSACRKVRNVEKDGYALAFAGAGSSPYIDFAVEEIARHLRSRSSFAEIRRGVAATLLKVHERHIWPNPQAGGFELLIAASKKVTMSPPILHIRPNPEHYELWHTYDSTIVAVDNYKFIGTGGAIVDYLGERLYDPSLTVEKTVFLAAQVLRHAKTYGTGCGGRSDIYILNERGVRRESWAIDVPRVDQGFEALEHALAPLLLDYLNPLVPEDRFEGKLKAFDEDVRRLRSEYVGLIEERAKSFIRQWDEEGA